MYKPKFAVLRAKYDYKTYFTQCIKSPERALIRKAIKNGYSVKEIAYDSYLLDIKEINTSKDMRNGCEMSDDYKYPKKRDCVVKPINSNIYTYGCFDAGGKLVAYYMFEKITNFYHTVKGIGHRDHLKNGIMNYLFAYSVGQLSEKQECDYIVYGMITPHGEGLDRFKRQAGCQIRNLMILGNKEQFKTLKYFKRTYRLHGDSGLNFVSDYC